MALHLITAGESHGPGLTCIIEGLPAGLAIEREAIDRDLHRRQLGHGRGGRMKIEKDRADVTGGVRHGKTLGSPIALQVVNRDFANWEERMNPWPVEAEVQEVHLPRPGHADLVGTQKYGFSDVRNVLERASARETAMRVCLGAICAQLLEALGIRTQSYVARIGSIEAPELDEWDQTDVEASDVRCPHRATAELMIAAIDAAKAAGDTLGGKFVVRIDGVPVGVGSNRQPNQRLDGILGGAVMGMQTVRAVEIGLGAEVAATPGSAAHDVFALDGESVVRTSNRAGGIEGGMSNGEPIVVRVAVKPIPTLMKALPSVNLHEGTGAPAAIVRSDVCVVPAAAIVAEAMVRLALVGPVLEKYGGDSMEETLDNLERSREAAARLFAREGAPRRQ
jgi:chorismate synthase